MKIKILFVLTVLCVLIASSTASASSKNSEMPTSDQFDKWIGGFDGKSDFVESAYNGYIEEFPKGHVDKIKDNTRNIVGIVFYNYNPAKGTEGYDSNYYDVSGNKMGIGCNTGYTLTDQYKGEGSSNSEKGVKEEKPVANDDKEVTNQKSSFMGNAKIEKTSDEEEDDEEDEETDDEDDEGNTDENTYSALVEFLEDDDTNEQKWDGSKDCATHLNEVLSENGWESKIVKAKFKKTSRGKYPVRYCVEVTTADESKVNIDSYGGDGAVDKRVTQLKKGKIWKADCVSGTCTKNYNRGKVMKITYLGD